MTNKGMGGTLEIHCPCWKVACPDLSKHSVNPAIRIEDYFWELLLHAKDTLRAAFIVYFAGCCSSPLRALLQYRRALCWLGAIAFMQSANAGGSYATRKIVFGRLRGVCFVYWEQQEALAASKRSPAPRCFDWHGCCGTPCSQSDP